MNLFSLEFPQTILVAFLQLENGNFPKGFIPDDLYSPGPGNLLESFSLSFILPYKEYFGFSFPNLLDASYFPGPGTFLSFLTLESQYTLS